jgi:hypothetical protein
MTPKNVNSSFPQELEGVIICYCCCSKAHISNTEFEGGKKTRPGIIMQTISISSPFDNLHLNEIDTLL